ncbi:hypothetical protein QE370_001345 [Aeromicrobium sp. SORGH_AS981]|uniref:hypothetical protein n=1 Tax=Aeromicrobium sp. SORGH_AS_0981 TaxID=3041802 RepID=UPI002862CEC8|nr:hypothetical protein [Aeromicrobium sp. SORGH_AS_0981]MDR6118161.1 hypothetical protein [Aeromicrobium sp. SORGH_AS_0981]
MSTSQHDPDRAETQDDTDTDTDTDDRRPDEKPFGDDAQDRQGDDAASGGS